MHGLLLGRVVRLLADAAVPADAGGGPRFAAHLSIGIPAAGKAAWAEGFLSGGGLLLVHDRDLLGVLDGWVASLAGQDFMDVLPLLQNGRSASTRRPSGPTSPRRSSGWPAGRTARRGRGRLAGRRPRGRLSAHGRRHPGSGEMSRDERAEYQLVVAAEQVGVGERMGAGERADRS